MDFIDICFIVFTKKPIQSLGRLFSSVSLPATISQLSNCLTTHRTLLVCALSPVRLYKTRIHFPYLLWTRIAWLVKVLRVDPEMVGVSLCRDICWALNRVDLTVDIDSAACHLRYHHFLSDNPPPEAVGDIDLLSHQVCHFIHSFAFSRAAPSHRFL